MRIILITFILTVNLSHPLFAKIASVIGNPLSQEIYFEVNKDTKNYPASLTKIMTLYILFDELKLKKINLNDRIYFSKHATYQQPSKLGIAEKDFITVDELIDSLIIKSANDAAVAIAEKISGTEKKFVIKMNDYAKKLNASVILRGLRVVSDFEYEFQMSSMNKKLNQNIESIFLTPSESYAFLSSSLVKEIAKLGGDVTPFVSNDVKQALMKKFKQ